MKNQLTLLSDADTDSQRGKRATPDAQPPTPHHADRSGGAGSGRARRAHRAHVGASAAREALREAVRRSAEREKARREAREAALLAALSQPHLPLDPARPDRHAA